MRATTGHSLEASGTIAQEPRPDSRNGGTRRYDRRHAGICYTWRRGAPRCSEAQRFAECDLLLANSLKIYTETPTDDISHVRMNNSLLVVLKWTKRRGLRNRGV